MACVAPDCLTQGEREPKADAQQVALPTTGQPRRLAKLRVQRQFALVERLVTPYTNSQEV